MSAEGRDTALAGAKADAEATKAAERRAEVFIVLVVVGFIMAMARWPSGRSDDVFWCGAQNNFLRFLAVLMGKMFRKPFTVRVYALYDQSHHRTQSDGRQLRVEVSGRVPSLTDCNPLAA